MKIWAIADLHFDYSTNKPMDIFGDNWQNHKERIIDDWKTKVAQEDAVLVAGDISWGLKLSEAEADLRRIEKLPGRKFFVRGNHDYWWDSLNKISMLGLKDMTFIQNNSVSLGDYRIGGTRAWIPEDYTGFTEDDAKIFRRECMRLENSLSSMEEGGTRIAMIHYPPFSYTGEETEFTKILKKYDVKTCVYGHVHGERTRQIREGFIDGIEYVFVSCDLVDFKLKRLY